MLHNDPVHPAYSSSFCLERIYRIEEEDLFSHKGAKLKKGRTTWKCIPISVYQCASVVEYCFPFVVFVHFVVNPHLPQKPCGEARVLRGVEIVEAMAKLANAP